MICVHLVQICILHMHYFGGDRYAFRLFPLFSLLFCFIPPSLSFIHLIQQFSCSFFCSHHISAHMHHNTLSMDNSHIVCAMRQNIERPLKSLFYSSSVFVECFARHFFVVAQMNVVFVLHLHRLTIRVIRRDDNCIGSLRLRATLLSVNNGFFSFSFHLFDR